ncbi:MAG TPA: trypsin-like peptidase domain-containing protein [Gaiellaceae bacterium]|nr:trypsin-like peptidase domain-containing protein [Gaiellaceae bacterium]
MIRRLLFLPLLLLALAVAAPAPAAVHGKKAHAGVHAKKAKPKPKLKAKRKPNPNTGIVEIYTTLGYQSGQAAGTGMILDADGDVLTNNHVIKGATVFKIVVGTTKRTFTATVAGYSVSEDVALLKIDNPVGLAPVLRGNSSKVRVGMEVVARGNAGGRGCCTVARGTVTGLHREITASDEQGGSELLSNLIETDAGIEAGDSGGPLFNAIGRVIGMVTAGSSSRFGRVATRGYAIPINKAMGIVREIQAGATTTLVHVGPTAFLGVGIQDAPRGGVYVGSLVPGGAAEQAGLAAGVTITSLAGTAVGSSDELQDVVLQLTPGEPVAIEWLDAAGAAQSGTITPASGPPQ